MVTRSLVAHRRALVAVLALPLLILAFVGIDPDPPPAEAQVVQRQGFRATVMGWSSWYGSYGMGPLGAAWCIDHGSRAPDAAYGYAPTTVDALSDGTRAAMAWAVSRHSTDDRVGAAALMLVMHHLRGAQYPFGRLDLDRMTVRDLAGFDGQEGQVLHRAREIRNDALAHSRLRGPLELTATAPTLRAGEEGDLTVELRDAAGRGVDGVDATITVEGATALGPTLVRTDAAGRAGLRIRAAEGPNRFSVSTTAPDPSLQVWGSTSVTAQRVVRPATVSLTARAEFTGRRPTGMVLVAKEGDAEPYLSVAGAIFEVHHVERGPVKTLVTGPDGRTPAAELEVGDYLLVETRPPVGYEAVDPIAFTVTEGEQAEIPVLDPATRTDLVIDKIDTVSREGVPGAEIGVDYDADRDGTFETAITSLTTTEKPTTIGDLLPGAYRVSERRAPDHYVMDLEPVDVQLAPGSPQTVTIENAPAATVSFAKVPESEPPPGTTLAGAVFTVNEGGGDDVPSDTTQLIPPAWACITDEHGRCALPDDSLLAGHEYCWSETEAPAGFGQADGGCFTPAEAGEVVEISVVEPVLASPLDDHAEVESSAFSRPEIAPGIGPSGALPVTGSTSASLVLVGVGLVLLGATLSVAARRRARND